MKLIFMTGALAAAILASQSAEAHVGAWAKGMYCLGGANGANNMANNLPAVPFRDKPTYDAYWAQAKRGCDKSPPPEGEFLELPVGGSFTVEMASNRMFTQFGRNGSPKGPGINNISLPYTKTQHYTSGDTCVVNPNLHTAVEERGYGSAFGISYHSNLKDVTPQNTVVFSVRYNTPYLRVVNFDVPKDLPPCPPGGCHCYWGWVPGGCGPGNLYFGAFKCNVTGSTSTKRLGVPKPPATGANVKGAKQMVIFNTKDGDNVKVEHVNGKRLLPGYNSVCGFKDGAQNDIFVENDDSDSGSYANPNSTTSDSTESSAPSENSTPSESSMSASESTTTSVAPTARPTVKKCRPRSN